MKSAPLPVLAIQSFPQPPAQRAYYVERLETHVARFPHVNEPHAHDFYLLLYITHGRGTHTIDLTTYELRPGSVFFLAPGQVHHWELEAGTAGYIVFFTADFYLFRYPGSRLYEYPFFAPPHRPTLYLRSGAGSPETELLPLLERLYAESFLAHDNQADVVRTYLYLLLELAVRHYPPAASPEPEARYAQQQVRAFEALLNQHYRQLRTVRQYAERLPLSANHLNAVCRRVLNKTASALIHERVVVEAQRLLSHSALSVAQVAYELGFEDASYFTRYFRKYAGLTPEAFRQQPR